MENYNIGNCHIALITEDIKSDFARMTSHATFRQAQPVAIEWGPYAGGWAARLRDPDGITIELIELPKEGRQPGAGLRS
jgi:hypothetical protein